MAAIGAGQTDARIRIEPAAGDGGRAAGAVDSPRPRPRVDHKSRLRRRPYRPFPVERAAGGGVIPGSGGESDVERRRFGAGRGGPRRNTGGGRSGVQVSIRGREGPGASSARDRRLAGHLPEKIIHSPPLRWLEPEKEAAREHGPTGNAVRRLRSVRRRPSCGALCGSCAIEGGSGAPARTQRDPEGGRGRTSHGRRTIRAIPGSWVESRPSVRRDNDVHR